MRQQARIQDTFKVDLCGPFYEMKKGLLVESATPAEAFK